MARQANFYLDEPSVVSFFIGELGWALQYFQGYFRYLKREVYPDHQFFIMSDINFHEFWGDFVCATLPLPDEFYQLGLDRDCYEAIIPGSPASSLTPPDVYSELIRYFRHFYNQEKAKEIWTPRGWSDYMDYQQQVFINYTSKEKLESDRPIVTVLPRARARAAQRNVPQYVWFEVVERLRKAFTVVLAGTPSGACLDDYEAENVINLISYTGDDKTSKIVTALNSSIVSISSQSGGTHVSLLSGCPSYIIGHEKVRHTFKENRTETAVSFRYVSDYRAIDADTIIRDVQEFTTQLLASKEEETEDFDVYQEKEQQILNKVYTELNNE